MKWLVQWLSLTDPMIEAVLLTKRVYSTSTWIRGILNSSNQVSDFSDLSPSRSQSSLTLGMNAWTMVQWVFITEE